MYRYFVVGEIRMVYKYENMFEFIRNEKKVN